ncbi:hypothetical protein [Streptomyces sp. NPDC097981]|uniref:hypothetical protein n=1 Tax=Streptomyces sp. NPDC097981 TaxID=3155428 RepID=UPI00332E776F
MAQSMRYVTAPLGATAASGLCSAAARPDPFGRLPDKDGNGAVDQEPGAAPGPVVRQIGGRAAR